MTTIFTKAYQVGAYTFEFSIVNGGMADDEDEEITVLHEHYDALYRIRGEILYKPDVITGNKESSSKTRPIGADESSATEHSDSKQDDDQRSAAGGTQDQTQQANQEVVVVGELKGNYINRNTASKNYGGFENICFDFGGELQEIARNFFNDNGDVRYSKVDGLEKDNLEAMETQIGGFIHLYTIKLNEEHRHKDIGIKCITKLLAWIYKLNFRDRSPFGGVNIGGSAKRNSDGEVLDSLTGRPIEFEYITTGWNICCIDASAIMPNTEHFMDHYNRMHSDSLTAEDVALENGKWDIHKDATRKLRRQYARIGFQQHSRGSPYFYLLPSRMIWPPLSKEEVARSVNITDSPFGSKLNAMLPCDRKLTEYLEGWHWQYTSLGKFQKKIDRFVDDGADMSRCNGIQTFVRHVHRAGSNPVVIIEKLRILLSKGVDINDADHNGDTALHHAAQMLDVRTVEILLAVQANPNLRNTYLGQTALDIVIDSVQNMRGGQEKYNYLVDLLRHATTNVK
eukprot:CAMPEP_0196815356 /NCGR_PEP_ID=MMETSP1362-20130617/49230_1 /TAXON_ID=163516 /ORGANISM="Leptocylindrus danicus, Strain CCMP1856" /LENGTH=510 /DNA_ID=CAMNT_0042192275 /DNA_START=47 /DNA_END=1579 /DNA_ORIENTATION=-